MLNLRQGILFLSACLFSCAGISVDGNAVREKEEVRKSEMLYQSRAWTDRLKAVENVKPVGSIETQRFLSRAAADPHERVRIGAIRGLSLIRNDRSFRTILEIAQTEKEPNARWEAFQALAGFRKADAAPLFASAVNDPDWLMRETSVAGLLDIDDAKTRKESLPLAVEALSDSNENVRIAALSHLTLTDQRVYVFIARQLSGKSYYKRTGYLKVLLATLAKYKLDKEMRSSVLEYMTHPDAQIRVIALQVVKNSDARQ